MIRWVKELDRVLRGEATRPEVLGQDTIQVPAFGLSVVIVCLAAIYGACMGGYAIFGHEEPRWIQLEANLVKVPALFFLTLVVTFPSLYVFNALVGSRLTVMAVMRLLVASLGVNLAVLASLGPIVAFFSVNTTNYSFMVLLNVLVFAISGSLGLMFLLQTLHRMSITEWPATPDIENPAPDAPKPSDDDSPDEPAVEAQLVEEALRVEEAGPLDRVDDHVLGRHVKTVFGCWIIVFGLVGAQMSWILRPFIGSPDKAFQWFRPRGSNFFEAVWQSLQNLFG